MNTNCPPSRQRQQGVATVEFALVSIIFFTLLFGTLEFARMLFVYNTLQEVTRRTAREMTVRWVTDEATAKSLALFGAASLPGAAAITADSIQIDYLTADGNIVANRPSDPGDNLSACGDAGRTANCIYSVRVSINPVNYSPMLAMFSFLNLALPSSSVTMHAESMGFET
ncbi:MAG: TadE family protein [Pseudomonadota bacterium]